MNRYEQREQAFLLIFESTFKDESLEEIIKSAQLARDLEISNFSIRAFNGVKQHKDEIDELIDNNSIGWKRNRLSRVMLSALRLSIYEMLYEKNIPQSVSINEAINLVKLYGSQKDASFINGILSGVYKEMNAKHE
mgnify:FL=1